MESEAVCAAAGLQPSLVMDAAAGGVKPLKSPEHQQRRLYRSGEGHLAPCDGR